MTNGDTMDNKPAAAIVGILCVILTGVFTGNGDYASGATFAIVGIITIIVLLKTDSGETGWKESYSRSLKAGFETTKWLVIGVIIGYLFITYF
jgi:hypothetical protein